MEVEKVSPSIILLVSISIPTLDSEKGSIKFYPLARIVRTWWPVGQVGLHKICCNVKRMRIYKYSAVLYYGTSLGFIFRYISPSKSNVNDKWWDRETLRCMDRTKTDFMWVKIHGFYRKWKVLYLGTYNCSHSKIHLKCKWVFFKNPSKVCLVMLLKWELDYKLRRRILECYQSYITNEFHGSSMPRPGRRASDHQQSYREALLLQFWQDLARGWTGHSSW